MKQLTRLFAMGLSIVGLSACTSDLSVDNVENQDESGTHYLSVNIVNNSSTGTRSEDDESTGAPGEYEYGYTAENTVSSVRFYFFDDNGNAVAINSLGTNYANAKPDTEEDDEKSTNIEKKLKATILINTEKGRALPTQIVAIINPEHVSDLGNSSISTIQALREITQNFVPGEKENFVMSNSVYVDSKGNEIFAAAIDKDENLKETEDEALDNPVNIYVERTMAKVRTYVKGAEKVGNYEVVGLKDSEGEDLTVSVNMGTDENPDYQDKEIYLLINGWNLSAETDKGYLGKKIDLNWGTTDYSTLFGTEVWNHYPYYRSFWAKIPDGTTTQFRDFYANTLSVLSTGEVAAYTNENTDQTMSGSNDEIGRTKVVIAGQLCYKTDDGKYEPVEICKYHGETLIGEDALKIALLNTLATNAPLYKQVTTESGTEVKSIETTDVKFVTATEYYGSTITNESAKGRYYSYLQLEDNATTEWYSDKDCNNKIANANTYILEHTGKQMIYASGQTYYYFTIKHLGNEGKVGYYGAVRNHIYDCTVTNITGLGTPVYDPTETIYPEKPSEEYVVVAAAINILSWRVVEEDYDLLW